MAAPRSLRTVEDLERAVRAIATEFQTDKVFVIGSQGILLIDQMPRQRCGFLPKSTPIQRTLGFGSSKKKRGIRTKALKRQSI